MSKRSMPPVSKEPILVTGGTGFLGQALRRVLANQHIPVKLLVREDSNINPRESEHLIRGDVRNPEDLQIGDCNRIIHLAAQTNVDQAIKSPIETWQINANGTLHVLEAARAADIDRLLLTSTASVYGPPTTLPMTEDHALQPVEPYGASKLAADRLAHAYVHTYDIPVITARLFNTFGPGQSTQNVVASVVSQAITNDQIRLGNLTPSRDFTYIDDAIAALLVMLEDGKVGEVYNVGTGKEITIETLAKKVVEIVNREIDIISTSEYQRDEDVDASRVVADATRLGELGWRPKVGFEEGLQATVDGFRDT